jgi:hypothetical protein
MSNRLSILNIIKEDSSGGGTVHASGPDFASFVTGGGVIDWKNLIPDSPFGKNKPWNRRGTDVSNSKDGGVAHAIAQAMFSAEYAEGQLRDLGVNISDLSDQDTIDYYKALTEFKLIFSLEEPIDEFFGGQKDNIEGVARVDKRSNAKKFVIYFKHDGIVYKMDFVPKSLQKNLKGTASDLPMLIKNEFYDVRFSKTDLSDEQTSDSEGDDENVSDGEESDVSNKGDDGVESETTQYVKLKKEDLNELNSLIDKLTNSSNKLKSLKLNKFSDNKNFRDALLLNLIRSKMTNIKVNGEPISLTLKKLKDNGLLEAPARDINKKQQLPQGWENQMSSFFETLFKVFARLNKCCKSNPTYIQIKKFFKLLYLIVKEGQANYSDEKKREQLYKKLIGTITNFINQLSKSKIKFTNSTKSESVDLSIENILEDILTERKPKQKTKPPKGSQVGKGDYWDDGDESEDYHDRKIKINDIPTFSEGGASIKKGSESNEPVLFIGKLQITDGGGNPTWSLSGAENKVNTELSKGVIIKKSMKHKDYLIIEWSNPFELGGQKTKAMLIKPSIDIKDFLFKAGGNGVNGADVEIGRKVGGDESIENPAKGRISLKLKD